VRSVARGLGFWGDMVLVLNDGMKLEMRAVPRYRDAEAYIQQRIGNQPGSKASNKAGFGASEAA